MSSFCRLVIGQFINGTLLRAPVGGGGSGGHGVQKAVNHVLPKGESGTGTSSLPRPTTSHNGNPSHNTQDDNSSRYVWWLCTEAVTQFRAKNYNYYVCSPFPFFTELENGPYPPESLRCTQYIQYCVMYLL